MLALMLMAYEFAGKQRDLSLADVTRPDFQEWFGKFERSLARHGGSLTHSTGTLMQEMVKRGPSQYDALLVYENLAVEFVKIAREHWGDEGELRVVYPELNIWNDHPYYILDVPWSSAAERRAAADFLAFLMTEPIQRLALRDGFRPGNLSVSPRFPGSPLIENERYGVRVEIALRLCEPPRAEVLSSLLASFQRIDQ
jgi:ABC-type sulfate transport system substrate-binding protein